MDIKRDVDKYKYMARGESEASLQHAPSSWSLNSSSPLLQRQRNRSKTVNVVPSDLLDRRDPKGRTPLFLAVRDGDLREAKRLLDMGCQVDLTDNYNVTPLHEATEKLNKDIIELLLDYGKSENLLLLFYSPFGL